MFSLKLAARSSMRMATLVNSRRLASQTNKLEPICDQVIANSIENETTKPIKLANVSTDNLKWEIASAPTIPAITNKISIISGAIVPWAQLNFFQKLFFPYTFATMYYLDFLSAHMPWWVAIIATTATARILFSPVVVKLNKIGIITYNLMPETQRIQSKMNDALLNNDAYNLALCKTKLHLLYKENNISIKQRIVPILVQAPMYASMFFLLRILVSEPVEGLTTGGTLWFKDLTISDPFYILPAITCTSMFLLLEFGLEGGMNPTGMLPIGKYIMRALPIGMFAFIYNFPAATLLFWATSNIFTLVYALILKNKWVKKKLNIPTRKNHKPEDLPMASMSFSGQVKKAISQGKVRRTTMDVRRLDDIAFRKAGIGPLQKTYKEPPKD